ncbi:hypothetical protein DITRI_Ditri02bG0130800 [Diplodiscus trichospermus]
MEKMEIELEERNETNQRFMGIGLIWVEKANGDKIGERLGRVIKVEDPNGNKGMNQGFLRIRVGIKMGKPLVEGKRLKTGYEEHVRARGKRYGNMGESFWVNRERSMGKGDKRLLEEIRVESRWGKGRIKEGKERGNTGRTE